jgi:hypothetical protein
MPEKTDKLVMLGQGTSVIEGIFQKWTGIIKKKKTAVIMQRFLKLNGAKSIIFLIFVCMSVVEWVTLPSHIQLLGSQDSSICFIDSREWEFYARSSVIS